MARYNRWKFTALLLALLALLVAYPLLKGSEPFARLFTLLLVTVLVASLLALFQRRSSRLAAVVLGAPSLAGVLTHHLLPATAPALASLFFHLFPVIFLGYTVGTILTALFAGTEVSADSISGAFCGYLLIGLAFGHLYCLAETFAPGSFLVQEHLGPLPAGEGRRLSLLAYFSLITLTTVGYGDVLPRSAPARTLAWVEAVIGQFYVAVVIAELIALKVSAAVRERRPDGPRESGPQ
jgi:hypothetical protein